MRTSRLQVTQGRQPGCSANVTPDGAGGDRGRAEGGKRQVESGERESQERSARGKFEATGDERMMWHGEGDNR